LYVFKGKVNNSTEHCPSAETNPYWTSQEIPDILWNPKIYYHVHKSLQRVPNLSMGNSVYKLGYNLFKISLFVLSYICLCFPSGFFALDFPTKTLCAFVFSPLPAVMEEHRCHFEKSLCVAHTA
jgi:hypothetical protein